MCNNYRPAFAQRATMQPVYVALSAQGQFDLIVLSSPTVDPYLRADGECARGGFALTVALGLRYLGVLLMGSLIIIPAATAKRLARSLTGMLVCAVVVAVLDTVLGTLVAHLAHRPTGPIIISVATGFFLLSLLRRQD